MERLLSLFEEEQKEKMKFMDKEDELMNKSSNFVWIFWINAFSSSSGVIPVDERIICSSRSNASPHAGFSESKTDRRYS